MLTLAFPRRHQPLNAVEPTVLAVGQLLREVIIALAEDHTLGPDDRADLYRIALRRLNAHTGPATPPACAGRSSIA